MVKFSVYLNRHVFVIVCAQRWRKLACASAQSEKSLRGWHEVTLHPWLSKMRPVKILIRLRECTGWSKSSLSAHVRRYVFWRRGANIQVCKQTRRKIGKTYRCSYTSECNWPADKSQFTDWQTVNATTQERDNAEYSGLPDPYVSAADLEAGGHEFETRH